MLVCNQILSLQFVTTSSDPKAGEIVCVLDGLDECEESGRYQIMDALSAFYKKDAYSSRNVHNLKLLVTSRLCLDIERRFKALTREFPTIRLQGEHESKAIGRELGIVIKWRVLEPGREQKLSNSKLSILEDGLMRITHRTCLWLHLIFGVIRDEIGLTKRQLKQIVTAIPATVDQAYEAIMSKIRERDRTRVQKNFGIIVIVTRPLTLKEMNIALAMEAGYRSSRDLDLENEARFKSTIRHLCGLFVNFIDQKIYLIHQTAKEFLVAKSEVFTKGWKYSLDLLQSELLLATICVDYVNYNDFDDDLIPEDHDDNAVSDILPTDFFNYAASSWPTHFRKSQTISSEELLHSVLSICDTDSSRYDSWFQIYRYLNSRRTPRPYFTNSLMEISFFGHAPAVRLLIKRDDINLQKKKDWDGRTPLILAGRSERARDGSKTAC